MKIAVVGYVGIGRSVIERLQANKEEISIIENTVLEHKSSLQIKAREILPIERCFLETKGSKFHK